MALVVFLCVYKRPSIASRLRIGGVNDFVTTAVNPVEQNIDNDEGVKNCPIMRDIIYG